MFAALDPEQLEKGFVAWVGSIAKLTAGDVVAIDGKALCGTRAPGTKAIVHMVSAWAEGNGLVLAQRKVDEKSNEITAIPKLLDALALSGTVVTIDAMGCQRSIAGKIIEKKADYILAVKDNQGGLLDGIKDSFQMLAAAAVAEEIDCGPRARREPPLLRTRRPVAGREGCGMAVVTGLGAYSSRAISQGYGQDRTSDPLLHHQSQARCGAAEPGHPPALGHRKQAALDARCRLRRRPQPKAGRPLSTKLLPAQPNRPQHPQARQNLQKRNQGENDSTPLGTTPTSSNYSEFDMRRP